MKQRGGYYPSVFEGVRGAYYLLPLVLRQAYSLYNSKSSTRRRIKRQRNRKTRTRRF